MAGEGESVDLNGPGGELEILEVLTNATLIRVCGRWGREVGSCGVFTLQNTDHSLDDGDPGNYPKTTSFDSHYHDFDEYWILFEGKGVVVTEGKSYAVAAGDCIATGMGHHHDFPRVFETVRGVYFEGTLEGEKRLGHLWNHEHGQAQPKYDRT